jgi:hypothetical protein
MVVILCFTLLIAGSAIDLEKYTILNDYLIPFIAFVSIILFFTIIVRQVEKGKHDETANKIDQIIKDPYNAKIDKPVVLYIRPFESTNYLAVQYNPPGVPGMARVPYRELEDELSSAFGNKLYFIALGEGKEIKGAVKLDTSEDYWWQAFTTLAKIASYIFIVPSHRPSTKREIKWLAHNLNFRNCIFIMPEEAVGHWARKWNEAKEELKNINVNIPEYDSRGMFFKMDQSGIISLKVIIGLSSTFFKGSSIISKLRRLEVL